MSPADDDDDVTVDELLIAGCVAPGDEALSQVVAAMRAMAAGPEPRPGAALEALFTAGVPAASQAASTRTGTTVWRRALRWVAGLGVAGKVALGAGVAVAGTTGVATIPAVPDAVQAPVRDALVRVEQFFVGEPPQVVVPEGGATPASGAVPPGGASPEVSGAGPQRAAPAAPGGESQPGASGDEAGQADSSTAPGSGEDANGSQGGTSSQGSDSRSTTAPGGRPSGVPGRPTADNRSTDGSNGQQPTQRTQPTPSASATRDVSHSGGDQQGGNGQDGSDSQQ